MLVPGRRVASDCFWKHWPAFQGRALPVAHRSSSHRRCQPAWDRLRSEPPL